MSDKSPAAPVYHARRRHFIDRNVQGRLIAGLILIEVLLFAAAMWFVYLQMQTAIDQELYRVHQLATRSSPLLISALRQTLPWIVLANLLVLFSIDWIWGSYVNMIIHKLRQLARQVAALDLRSQPNAAEHDVLRQAMQWVASEQARCQTIRQLVLALPVQTESMQTASHRQLIEQLRHLHQQLP
jgi:hypothetical protein